MAAGATSSQTNQTDAKGKIVEFAWWLKKNGKADSTIKTWTLLLKLIAD